MANLTGNPIKHVGLGLRHKHFKEFIDNRPEVPWLEVHPENFFSTGSTSSKYLETIRRNYPISGHCVGLSLGSSDKVDIEHLRKLQIFINRFEPVLVSDHLSWNAEEEIHLPDLLPLPYTEEALNAICRNVNQVQEFLGRQILVENPSSYLAYAYSPIPEWEFFVEIAKRTGCGLLFDVNNVYVSANNHGFDANIYVDYIPAELVQEIHLAGYTTSYVEDQEILIDDHGAKIYNPVWDLYERTIRKMGEIPTLIEWDTNIPELSVLMDEKHKAENIIKSLHKDAA